MSTPLIYDALIALVLLWCVLRGYARGFILSVSSIVVLILACLGANFASQIATPTLSAMVQPYIETAIHQQLAETMDGQLSLEQALNSTEFAPFLPLLEGELLSDVSQKAEDVTTATLETVAYLIADGVVGFVLWVVTFLALLIVLTVAIHALNLVAKLPVLSTANALCGGLAGAVWGILAVHVLLLLLGFAGRLPTEAQAAQTYLYRLFVGQSAQTVATLVSIV